MGRAAATIHDFPGAQDAAAPEAGAERSGAFSMIPDAVRQLKNPYATQVYFALMMRATRERFAWPSHACIADDSGVSERKVREMLRLLEHHGMITSQHGRHANMYFLVEPQDIPPVVLKEVTRHDVPTQKNINGQSHSAHGAGHSAPHAGHSARGDGHSAPRADKLDPLTRPIEPNPVNQTVITDVITATPTAGGNPPPAQPPAKPDKGKPKPPKTQTEQERMAFAMVDAFARGANRAPSHITGKERYDARKTFEPLVDDYSPDDIEGCTAYLYSKPFWRDGNLGPITVVKALPNWLSSGRPEQFEEPSATATFNGSALFKRNGSPTSAYFAQEAARLEAEEEAKRGIA